MSAVAASPMRSFDPERLGRLECDAWAGYYRREWVRVLGAFVGMIRAGFGMSWPRTILGAWYVLRANQLWAPYPGNDPDGARTAMRRFYALVAAAHHEQIDAAEAARLEVDWWRAHREVQREGGGLPPLCEALTALYAYVYSVPAAGVREAARLRAEAMVTSDEWVAAGCPLPSALLDTERAQLIESYGALLAAVRPR
ncbi:MAG: hypothetical protein QOJ50_1816 [Cryptosporangiaceae bacterium]|nr:hypothetical protein [Cryptosporangiaceae bacterium]